MYRFIFPFSIFLSMISYKDYLCVKRGIEIINENLEVIKEDLINSKNVYLDIKDNLIVESNKKDKYIFFTVKINIPIFFRPDYYYNYNSFLYFR